MTTTKTTPAHYVLVRFEGLKDPKTGQPRVTDERHVPVRLHEGQYCVRRRSLLLPVHALDAEGAARVRIAQEGYGPAELAIGHVPKTAEGSWDLDALEGIAPAVTDPWGDAVLAGARTAGVKPAPKAPKAPKAKAEPAKPEARPTGLKVTLQPKAGKAAAKLAPAPAPEPKAQLDQQAVIAYLAGLSSADSAALIAALQAAKSQPKAAKGRKAR